VIVAGVRSRPRRQAHAQRQRLRRPLTVAPRTSSSVRSSASNARPCQDGAYFRRHPGIRPDPFRHRQALHQPIANDGIIARRVANAPLQGSSPCEGPPSRSYRESLAVVQRRPGAAQGIWSTLRHDWRRSIDARTRSDGPGSPPLRNDRATLEDGSTG
jgi:hypothetical protein